MIVKTSISRLQKGYSFLLLALPFFAIAQGDSFTDDTNDVTPAAPIDNYIPLAIFFGVYFAYRFFKTQYIIKSKN